MSEPIKKFEQTPESYSPQKPEIVNMVKEARQIEKLVKTITYKGVEFEVVERTDVLWVGCVDYASNNTDESDIGATNKRYREELINVTKQDLINPDYSAALSINYGCNDKPCGIMFAQETYSDKQDERYDLFTQPGGLWIRTKESEATDTALLGRKNHGLWEYFGALGDAARENGYKENSEIQVAIEYYCHSGPGYHYAYLPIIKL